MTLKKLLLLCLFATIYGCNTNNTVKIRVFFSTSRTLYNVYTFSNRNSVDVVELLEKVEKLCSRFFNFKDGVGALFVTNRKVKEIEKNFLLKSKVHPAILAIQNNSIKAIRKHTFKDLTTSDIMLENNNIEVIEEEAFFNLSQLLTLNLFNNKLKNLDSNFALNLPDLKGVFLRMNELSHLKDGMFSFLKKSEGVIELSDNRIVQIDAEVFDGAGDNLTVNLEGNLIERFPLKIFRERHFDKLMLQGNPIRLLICDNEGSEKINFLKLGGDLDPEIINGFKDLTKNLTLATASKSFSFCVYIVEVLMLCFTVTVM